jgi:signal transduction histidine kinase
VSRNDHSALKSLNGTGAPGVEHENRWTRAALVVVAVSTLATWAIVAAPHLRFAYRAPGAHVAVETLVSLIAAFAALVVSGRMREAPGERNVLLFAALTIFSIGSVLTGALPAALSRPAFHHISTWGPMCSAVACGVALVAGSFDGCVRATSGLRLSVVIYATLAIVGAGALVMLFAPMPGTGVPPNLSPSASGRPLLVGSPALLVMRLASLTGFAVAGVRYVRQGRARSDALAGLLGIGCLLLAFARVNYLLFPSIDLRWFYFGDLWRLAGFLVILAAAMAELNRHWERLSEVAVLEERRRIARDLHDGVAQELAFLAAEGEGEHARAAQRALDESRRVIAALTEPLDIPFDQALRRAAEDVAMRYGRSVIVSAAPTADLTASLREQVIRIAREAVGNAARHSGGETISVRLDARRDRLHLLVEDDGRGFDPVRARERGHGLISMQERAQALNGTLSIRSAPRRGAHVELVLPL